jgi:hypothetical protein
VPKFSPLRRLSDGLNSVGEENLLVNSSPSVVPLRLSDRNRTFRTCARKEFPLSVGEVGWAVGESGEIVSDLPSEKKSFCRRGVGASGRLRC